MARGLPSGPGTIQAMPGTISDLKAKGYGFATVSQLLALQEPKVAASAPVEARPPTAPGNGQSAVQ